MRINIAIDGPSAAGKSTIAKKLAKQLGYVHLDTGAMYRCTAYKCLTNSISLDNEEEVCNMLDHTNIELKEDGRILLDGEDVSSKIRTDEISLASSKVSKLKKVRENLVARQQEMAKKQGFIMDGRDIGTVVLKDAALKIFMTASPLARAQRRYNQNIASNIPTSDVETIEKEIAQRDYEDTHRANSPLTKADDAIMIDTSDMSIDDVCNAIYSYAKPLIERRTNEE